MGSPQSDTTGDGPGGSEACAPLRILIYGSCVSRDALAIATPESPIVLAGYFARSSFACLSTPPGTADPAVQRITSAFQRRMVKADHEHRVIAALRTIDYDILLIDLIDERFNLLRKPDGSLVTLSNEYTAVAGRPLQGTVIPSGSAEHVRLWRQGLNRLAAEMAAAGRIDRVRINRVFWAEHDTEGRAVPGFTAEQTARANSFLHDRYIDLEAVFGTAVFLRYPPEILVSDRMHRWGASAFHYCEALYTATLAQLGGPLAKQSTTSTPPQPEAAEPDIRGRDAAAPHVELHSTPLGLTVSVNEPHESGLEFAYYLMRDQRRVAARWYSSRTSLSFPCPTIMGSYSVAVFERHRPSGRVRRYRSPSIRLPESSQYVASRWSRHVELYTGDRRLRPVNGVHRILGDGPASLDLLFQDFDDNAAMPVVVVCFGAAISGRDKKIPPFFSGISIGKSCGLPMIAIADPTVTRANNINLAWYAGNDQSPQLMHEIAGRLDELADARGSRLLLIGGSGGGFAALAVLGLLRTQASAIVWNAQTSISEYHIAYAHRYVLTAFPELSRKAGIDRLSAAKTTPDQLASCLQEAGVLHDLTRVAPVHHHPALFLLNESDDHHLDRHLKPLLSARQATWANSSCARDSSGLVAWIGNWGEGHAPPPAPFIEQLIGELSKGATVSEVADRLDKGKLTASVAPVTSSSSR